MNSPKGVHRTIENSTPAKIAIHPSDGVFTSCELRFPGSSKILFSFAKKMIEGMAKYVSVKAVRKLSNITSISIEIVIHNYTRLISLRIEAEGDETATRTDYFSQHDPGD